MLNITALHNQRRRKPPFFNQSKTTHTMNTQKLTYDIVFHDDNYSNAKGLHASLDYCKYYISSHNRSSNSYFSDYSGATVQIVCNETGQVVYSERIL